MIGESVIRWIVGKLMRLPPRQTSRIAVETGLTATMRDGVKLLADRYHVPGPPDAPLVLIRTPYGRGAMFAVMAGLMAERGLQVLVQSVRGTAGSEGRFDPMRQERDDGADTVDWVRAQPWFPGKLFTWGMSYLGNTQWAAAMDRAEAIDGMVLGVTLSDFRDELRSFGGFAQGGVLAWTATMRMLVGDAAAKLKRRMPKLDEHHGHLPLGTLDTKAFGSPVHWWQDWMAHDDRDDPFWKAMDYSAAVTGTDAPAVMTAGWNDIFLPFQLNDFAARQAAGKPSWITIGPWIHAAPGGMAQGVRDAVIALPALAEGNGPCPGRDRVRLYVNGAKEWRDYPSWPPPGAEEMRLHLQEGGGLDLLPPGQGNSSTGYIYDPADPTPAVHGPVLMGGKKVRDMAALEARSDTISFTTAPLESVLEVIGPVSVDLTINSDRGHTDFYACLCEVDDKGRAIQVCDGYIRLLPGKFDASVVGLRRISIDCWPTAWAFKAGHSLRLIIASGAHPRYARNLGTGEPMATATRMVAAQQQVFHDRDRPSSIRLMKMPG